MQEIQPGWQQILSIFWLLIWRGALGGFVISFALGLALNLILALIFKIQFGTIANLLIGLVIGLIWWPFVVRMALRKEYRGFRIALIAHDV